MFKWFTKIFIKEADENSAKTREAYGLLTGITGIILNVILCAAKIITGVVTGAISVVSDGINNLSDAGSSIITLIGFKLSAKKPDKKHPFGHGRMEYFAGLAVSVIIIVVAAQLFLDSVDKIINNQTPEFGSSSIRIVTIAVLAFSIAVKFWMAMFNLYCGKKINSVAMRATASDSLSDCVSTTVVLVCTLLSMFVVSFPIDGCAGIIVSIFIAFTGIKSVLEILDLLLGQAPDPELVKEIALFVRNYDKKILGTHDIVIHDYGPGRKMITLHVEVPAEENMMAIHDIIDNIEKAIENKYNALTTIHMDPVVTTSERVNYLKEKCSEIVKNINSDFDIHDFRMNEGETHGNLIFDLVLPSDNKISEGEITDKIEKEVRKVDEKLNTVINFEHYYV